MKIILFLFAVILLKVFSAPTETTTIKSVPDCFHSRPTILVTGALEALNKLKNFAMGTLQFGTDVVNGDDKDVKDLETLKNATKEAKRHVITIFLGF
ncbi:unnamed protein product [Caenorhabditis angaria]|uniref:Uncharacterized protein n=1 Tax=Caenorhabditis angaria TaxID=860376 RepID=A0A9P1IDD8_9PELO|nr:unnamed protein product [Caenorhabditis angaria]